jgi:hypothetical protein
MNNWKFIIIKSDGVCFLHFTYSERICFAIFNVGRLWVVPFREWDQNFRVGKSQVTCSSWRVSLKMDNYHQ